MFPPRSPPRQSANGPTAKLCARVCQVISVGSCVLVDGLGQNLLIPPCPLQQSCPETFRFSFAPRGVVRRVRVVFRCVLCQKSFSQHHRSLSGVVEEQLQMRGFDHADKKKRCAPCHLPWLTGLSAPGRGASEICVQFLMSPTC